LKYYMKRLLIIPAIVLTTFAFAQATDIDSLVNELKNAKPDTNKVNLLKNIGVALANQEPRTAIRYWMQGVELSRQLNYVTGLARNFINIGTGYAYLSRLDSSIIFYDSAIVYCKIIGNPERLALVYLNKGDQYRGLGDFRAALLYCDTARSYAERTTNTDRQARIYSIISNIYSAQHQFGNALNFLGKAAALYKRDDNNVMLGQAYDDFGIIYQQAGQLDSALIFRKMALNIGERERDYKNLSTYYFGVADIYTDQQKYKEADYYAVKALTIARQQENSQQLGTAYTLLSKIYLKQKIWIEAVKNGNLAWQVSLGEENAGMQQEAAGLLAEAYTGIGNYKEANRFLIISSNLKDSLGHQLFNQQVASLQASLELKNKDQEILVLGKDKELQQQKLSRQRLLFGAAAILFALVLLGIILLVNRNRLRHRMKELEIRNEIAADLHDEVGSSLSSIHMLSQMATQNGNEAAHKEIIERMSNNAKETMDKMGDIVWMIKPGEVEGVGLKQKMERFAYEICGSKNIEISIQLDDLEKLKLTMAQRKNIYLIFKEALNNAVKYSGTQKISIKGGMQGKELTLDVKDSGKGFDNNLIKRGNGLGNMQNRAREMNGQLGIKTGKEGTTIHLVAPL